MSSSESTTATTAVAMLHTMTDDVDFADIRRAVSEMLNDQWPKSELLRLKSIDEVESPPFIVPPTHSSSDDRTTDACASQSSDAFPMSVVLHTLTPPRTALAYCKLSVVLQTPLVRRHFRQPLLIVENGAHTHTLLFHVSSLSVSVCPV